MENDTRLPSQKALPAAAPTGSLVSIFDPEMCRCCRRAGLRAIAVFEEMRRPIQSCRTAYADVERRIRQCAP